MEFREFANQVLHLSASACVLVLCCVNVSSQSKLLEVGPNHKHACELRSLVLLEAVT